MIHEKVDGLSVYVWPEALTGEECDALIALWPEWPFARFEHDLALADRLGALALVHMPGHPPLGAWRNEITVSNRPIDWHFDRPWGAWKLCIYLDERPDGGTVFGREALFSPTTPRGTLALFDLGIEHRSADMKANKRILGLRAEAP